ncbi:MAG: carboxylating nicotinate-nucleotide diphosphorylase [Pseudomonadota bacterium]
MVAEVDAGTVAADVSRALAEDVGDGDLTAALVPASRHAQATVLLRETAVLCGRAWFEEALRQVDPALSVDWHAKDGQRIPGGTVVCEVEGPARGLLTAERTALNFLQLLSGVATATMALARLIEHTDTRILDTRKTLPGLRLAQKYAVRCGGGTNHRIGLFDAYLIKENHIASAGSMTAAIELARSRHPETLVVVEIEGLHQLDEALAARPDRIMLDNFTLAEMHTAVTRRVPGIAFEASGGIDRNTIASVAETGVDFISVGAITKHVRATDYSMRVVES